MINLVGSSNVLEKFTPYTYYSSAFQKRYESIKRFEINGKPPPEFNYVFPIKELEEVSR